MVYLELDEVKKALEERGIKYREIRYKEAVFVYVNALMQKREPTTNDKKGFHPEVRISHHEGDDGYYVKACGAIYKNQTIERIIHLIKVYAL